MLEKQLTVLCIQAIKEKLIIDLAYYSPKYNTKKEDYNLFLKKLGEIFIVERDYKVKPINWEARLTTTKGSESEKRYPGKKRVQFSFYWCSGILTDWPKKNLIY